MNSLNSSVVVIDNVAVIGLQRDDLEIANCGFLVSKRIKEESISKTAINIESFEYITSENVYALQKLIDVLEISGISVCVCGFDAVSASIIFTFVDDIYFSTALDVRNAILELNS
ncbi:hypothetical protein [Aliikangiella sp. G2MR2-5]|uniref:hypothetical protein n=1 Tax=Aliikangiella sp. G2MR2-5 TaxID=2788943 RepID=UPI0018A98D33|nr:hypothetical protein [Aliikangiella sp. G2MR2-5]